MRLVVEKERKPMLTMALDGLAQGEPLGSVESRKEMVREGNGT